MGDIGICKAYLGQDLAILCALLQPIQIQFVPSAQPGSDNIPFDIMLA